LNIAIIMLTPQAPIIYRSCDIRKRGRNVCIGEWDGMPDDVGGEDRGCRYIGDDGRVCGTGRQAGSSYCPGHRALCHVAQDSSEAVRVGREVAALAKVVGG